MSLLVPLVVCTAEQLAEASEAPKEDSDFFAGSLRLDRYAGTATAATSPMPSSAARTTKIMLLRRSLACSALRISSTLARRSRSTCLGLFATADLVPLPGAAGPVGPGPE